MRKLGIVVGIAMAVALSLPAAGWAHEGHAHKVMGTVSALTATSLELKTPDGTVVTVKLNPKTTVARGKQKVDAAALKAGERVVVEVASEKDMIASTVTMAAPTPVVAKK
jgi:hypothetical protein